MTWKPISSAPRDGTRFLTAIEGVDRPILTFWNGAGFMTIDGNDWTGRPMTDWHPLPLLPELPKETDDGR